MKSHPKYPRQGLEKKTYREQLTGVGSFVLPAIITVLFGSSSFAYGQQQVSQSISAISPEEALRIAKEFMAAHGDALDAQDKDLATQVVKQETPTSLSEEPKKEVDTAQELLVPMAVVTPSPAAEETEQVVSATTPDIPNLIQPESDVPPLRVPSSLTTSPATNLSEAIAESSHPTERQPTETPVFEKEMAFDIEPSKKRDLSIRIEGLVPSIAPDKVLVEIPSSEAPKAPKNLGLPTPSPSLSIEADGMQVRASPNTTSLSLKSNDIVLEAQVGAGYQSTSKKSATASYSMGALLKEDVAVGGTITRGQYRTDLSANLIKQLSSQEYLSLSLGYMRGREGYQFFTGEAQPKLEQSSIGLEYRNNSQSRSLGFKSFGLSIWGTRAKQIDRLDALTKIVETETSFDTYLDPRQLSLGTLWGVSLTGSFRPTKQLSIEPSVGYERLTFPFSDGSRELHRSQIASLDLAYSVNKSQSLLWSTRWGLSETRSSLGLKWGNWSLNLFHSLGERGLHNSKGVTLNYALLSTETSSRVSPPPWSPMTALNLDPWTLEEETNDKSTLLNMAATRPVVFTRAWLAKVDPTSVRLIESIPKVIEPPVQVTPPVDNNPAPAAPSTILSWTTTSLAKTYFDTGSPNRTAINFSVAASVNDGSAITYAWGNDPNNLQATLTLDPATGAITGSHPAVANDTTYSFSITASANGVSTSSNNFSVTIKSPVRVRFTTAGATVELGSATTTATSITFPADLTSIELLMVGGGGAGGGDDGGGGGGGGTVAYNNSLPVNGGTVVLNVGSGGVGSLNRGGSGQSSTFGVLIAPGGGGGGQSNPDYTGLSGGSGGGASQRFLGGSPGPECGTLDPSLTAYFCAAGGGTNTGGLFYGGSGGGGANGIGVTANGGNGGEGGMGYVVPASLGGGIVGAGGGGGGDGLPGRSVALGGSAVGGSGGTNVLSATDGLLNSGSGGGGGGLGLALGGNGSDGLILLRY